jgi:hypothetical protein
MPVRLQSKYQSHQVKIKEGNRKHELSFDLYHYCMDENNRKLEKIA